MTTPAIDMNLPETFHRLKRTTLLFSSVLVVLAIATAGDLQVLKLPFGDVTMPLAHVVGLLWGAAAYYLAGFLLEVAVAIRMNSERLRRATPDGFDAQFTAAAYAAKGLQETIETAGAALFFSLESAEKQFAASVAACDKALPTAVTELKDMAFEAGRDFVLRQPAPHLDKEEDIQAMLATLTGFANRLEHRIDEIVRGPQTLGQKSMDDAMRKVAELKARLEQTSGDLTVAHRDLKRLAAAVTGARQASFWGWEVVGAVFPFIVATVLNFERLNAAAFDLRVAWGMA